ncbi:MAG: hypothetical protein EOP53_23500 [Sphingobacteriales bacterium]|nr:MAG: hypothetical protein EOP53_23500 [Sphingobacteriales bacterium]
MFWLFWMETLIISFFNAIRIVFSQGNPVGQPYTSQPLRFNMSKGLKYLLGRFLVFLFYSLFIIVFIGFIAVPKSDGIHVAKTLGFQNLLFNLALILCFVTQAYYLSRYFFMHGAYYYSAPEHYPMIFDGRQIVIHVAIVLGALGSTFLFKNVSNPRYAAIWVIATLCIVKCIYELWFLRSPDAAVQASNPSQADLASP